MRYSKDSELILGIISTVGTDVDQVIRDIKDQLAFFRYNTEVISVSGTVISQFEKDGKQEFPSEFERISHYMDLGNSVRKETHDNSILMKGVARELYFRRTHDDSDPTPDQEQHILSNHSSILMRLLSCETHMAMVFTSLV